ncbi:MAG: hypothetical protein KDA24_25425 [Deltaproteobacteria bacterium]|nr:hypothetical protein [Deltaproteobacteria bacterium]
MPNRTRLLLLAAAFLLCACPPVRPGDDDDSAPPSGGDLDAVWESLSPGSCLVLPEANGFLDSGAGQATNGLFYEVACIWTGGNASSVTLELSNFDEAQGGDFAVTGVRPTEPSGETVVMEGDLGSLHVLPGAWGTLNGWWEGDLSGETASGATAQLEAVVFKDARVDSVVGR